jgi:hypothetical protein
LSRLKRFPEQGRGRPRIYGKKAKLKNLFDDPDAMHPASSPVYGEKRTMIRFRSVDLIWRPAGILYTWLSVPVEEYVPSDEEIFGDYLKKWGRE